MQRGPETYTYLHQEVFVVQTKGLVAVQSCTQGTTPQTLAAPVAEGPLGSHSFSFTWQSAAGARSWLG